MKGLTTFQGQSEGRLLSLECALLENLFITKLNNFALINVNLLYNRLAKKKLATYYGEIGVGKGLKDDIEVLLFFYY